MMGCSHLRSVGIVVVALVVMVGRQGIGQQKSKKVADDEQASRKIRWTEQSIEERRELLTRLTDAEKSELLQKKRRFEQLTPEDQHRLRQLCAQISADPQHEHLRKILERYSEWLRTLTPGERAQVLSLPPDQRVVRIREILRAQESQRFRMMVDGRLNPNDLEIIRTWIDKFVADHEQEILAALPKDRFGHFVKDYEADRHRRFLSWVIYRTGTLDLPRPTKEDEALLEKAFSHEARAFLAKVTNPDERTRVLHSWIRAATFSRMRPRVSSEELEKFVAERLDDRQREYLESLPRDRMYRERLKLYFVDAWRRRGGDSGRRKHRGDNRSPGARRGPPWAPGKLPPSGLKRPDRHPTGPPSAAERSPTTKPDKKKDQPKTGGQGG